MTIEEAQIYLEWIAGAEKKSMNKKEIEQQARALGLRLPKGI